MFIHIHTIIQIHVFIYILYLEVKSISHTETLTLKTVYNSVIRMIICESFMKTGTMLSCLLLYTHNLDVYLAHSRYLVNIC